MSRACAIKFAVVLGFAGIADAAMVRMQWRGLGPDEAEIELAPHDTPIIDIYFEMNWREEALAELWFQNTREGSIFTQTTTEALLPGWMDLSIDGVLGAPGQFVRWVAEPGAEVTGPAEYLIGSQTIRLDDESVGRRWDITFEHRRVFAYEGIGDEYVYAPDFASLPGYFGIGLGKPQTPNIFAIDSKPLFVMTVPEPGSVALLVIGAVAVIRRRSAMECAR